MMQIIEQTHEEKMAMYMKLSKKELAQMLIEANRHLENRPIMVQPIQPYTMPTPGTWDSPGAEWIIPQPGTVTYDFTYTQTDSAVTVPN